MEGLTDVLVRTFGGSILPMHRSLQTFGVRTTMIGTRCSISRHRFLPFHPSQ